MPDALAHAKVKAEPAKRFFVRTLTRDIALDDCVLDLIDNAVDAAWSSAGSRPGVLEETQDLAPYLIDICIESNLFAIQDNCGGISLDSAINTAFSFGRPTNRTDENFSVGVYGIGMKRAIFKIGNEIEVRSSPSVSVGGRMPFHSASRST